MSENALSRIQAVSRVLRALALAGLIGLAALAGLAIVKTGWMITLLTVNGPENVTITGMVTFATVVVFLLVLLPPAYTLFQIRRLFTLFAEGRIFDPEPAGAIRRTGLGLLVMVVSGIIAKTVFVLLLTMHNPPGQRQLSISVSSDAYVLALFGGLMITLGWVLGEAARLSDENRQFV